MGDKVVVTGATGFIGRALVPILLHRGYEVTCIVRDVARAGGMAQPGVTLKSGDVTDRRSLAEPFAGATALFHLAGWYAFGNFDPAKMQAINVEGARNALEMAAELGVSRIVHTSSVAVFGNTNGDIADESYRVPKQALASLYERTKWEAHYEVAVPLQRAGAPITIVQPGAVTGPGDVSPHMDIFRYFLRRIPVMFGAKSGLTLAHVDDVAEGHLLALERGQPGQSYILAGPCMTYRQVFAMCESISGIPATRFWTPGWMASAASKAVGLLERLGVETPFTAEALGSLADYTFWGSADKAKRELGWTHRPVEDVLQEVLDYERARMRR
jgi:nucleoside-diphosphate-sugar epimerase